MIHCHPVLCHLKGTLLTPQDVRWSKCKIHVQVYEILL